MAITHLGLMNEIRQRLDDVGGDIGPPPAGFAYRWQYDDSGCLWKNLELVQYINETIYDIGLRKPAYDTDDPTICQITIVTGTRVYSIDPHVLSIDEARLNSTGLPLIKSTVKRMRELIARYRPSEDWRTATGAVTHYLEDEHTRQISLYRVPTTGDTLKLVVRRLYKDIVVWGDIYDEATPTVAFTDMPDFFRKALIHGTAALAYRKRDADTLNMDMVMEAQAAFEAEVGPQTPFVLHEQIRLSSNLWRSKSINEFMARRAQTDEAETTKARPNE